MKTANPGILPASKKNNHPKGVGHAQSLKAGLFGVKDLSSNSKVWLKGRP